MTPGDCYDRALHEAKGGNHQAAAAFALAGLLGHLLGSERLECRSLPLAEVGRDHKRIGEWAYEPDPRD